MTVQNAFAFSREDVLNLMDRLTAVFTAPDRICIDVKKLETTLPLDNHLTFPPTSIPTTRDDRLQSLPVEILHGIWQYTDVASLAVLRRTTRHLRDTITSQKQYQDVLARAPQLLRATLATRAASELRLIRAHHLVFSDKRCAGHDGCGNLGILIHLPTHERVCYDCLRYQPRFATPRTAAIRKHFLIPFTNIPILSVIPGFYGTSQVEIQREEGVSLFALNKARTALGQFPILSDWIGQYNKHSSSPVYFDRTVFAVRVPIIDLKSGEEIKPRICRGCFKVDPAYKGAQQVTTLSVEGFAEHATTCVGVSDRIRRMKSGRANDETEIERHFGGGGIVRD